MAVNKYGYKMQGLKRACALTRVKDGCFAAIYYDIHNGCVEVMQYPVEEGLKMPDGNWEDVHKLFIIHTFLPMTMQQITNEIAYKMVERAKD